MAAIGEDGELDAGGSPVVEEGVDRRAHRATRVEHVVNQDDGAAGEVEVEMRVVDNRRVAGLPALDVVAIEGDVEIAEGHVGAGELADQGMQAATDHRSARVDADQRQPIRLLVLLDDLVGDTDQRPPQIVVIEHDLLVAHCCSFPASQDRG